jgi:hypothetical protein
VGRALNGVVLMGCPGSKRQQAPSRRPAHPVILSTEMRQGPFRGDPLAFCMTTLPQFLQTHFRFLWKVRFCSTIGCPHFLQIIARHTFGEVWKLVSFARDSPLRTQRAERNLRRDEQDFEDYPVHPVTPFNCWLPLCGASPLTEPLQVHPFSRCQLLRSIVSCRGTR